MGEVLFTLRPAVTGLIAAAAWSVVYAALFVAPLSGGLMQAMNWGNVALYLVLLGLLFVPKVKNLHPVFFFLAGGIVGAVMGLI